jgi:hypothetical protein
MPRIPEIYRWNENPEYAALPPAEKQARLENYFDNNLAVDDEEFQGLPDIEKSDIRNNFVSDHMPEQPTEQEQPEEPGLREQIGRAGGRLGELSALGIKGVVRGVTQEVPEMVGKAAQYVGGLISGPEPTQEEQRIRGYFERAGYRVPDYGDNVFKQTGKDIVDFTENVNKLYLGEEPRPEGFAEETIYQAAKMIGPSVGPGLLANQMIRITSGVGRMVKLARSAEVAGNTAKAAEYMQKANELATGARNAGSLFAGSVFGLSQAQQTKETGLQKAEMLEQEGKHDEASIVRRAAEGWAPAATGLIEGIGETLGTWAGLKILGLDKAEIAKRGAKQIATEWIKQTFGVEVPTEVGQAVGQAVVEKYTGIRPKADVLGESLRVIPPTVLMSIFLGMGGATINTFLEDIAEHEIGEGDILKYEEKKGEKPKKTEAMKAHDDAVKIVKDNLELFRSQETGPPSTAMEAAEVLVGPEAVQEEIDRERLTGLGIQVPTGKSAEEAARAFGEPLPTHEAFQADEELIRRAQERQPEAIIPTETPVPPITETRPFEEAPEEQVSIPPERLAEKKPITEKPKEITKEEVDIKANEAATSPLSPLPKPTEKQLKAGNYKKAPLKIHGLDVSIENPKGSIRTGTDSDGETWETEMKSHYGYIKGTVGKDKDHLDVFVGDSPENKDVYVIDQVDPKTGEFDEHKVMMGFKNTRLARKGYKENYEKGWKGLGAITKMTVDEFKKWSSDKNKTKSPLQYKEPRRAQKIRRDDRR